MKFFLGQENTSGIKTDDVEEFIEYIREAIQEAEDNGETEFNLEITSG